MSFELPHAEEVHHRRPRVGSGRRRGFRRPVAVALGFIALAGLSWAGLDWIFHPSIAALKPAIGEPGETVSVIGKNFGSERGGSAVDIDGVQPTAASYLSWSDTEIQVRFPVAVDSGMVHVVTPRGRSNAKLFMNRSRLPVLATGELGGRSGPYLAALSAETGPVGSLLVLAGIDFGENRGESVVLFAWNPDTDGAVQRAQPGTVECSEVDLGYEYWSDKEIRVRIPDGAASGAVTVSTSKGRSNGIFFKVTGAPGSKTFKDPRSYSITQDVSISKIRATAPNELYIWAPRPASSSSQRVVKVLSQEPMAMVPDYRGTALFRFKDITGDSDLRIQQSFLVQVYAVETSVGPADIQLDVKDPPGLVSALCAPDERVPSGAPEVQALARKIVGNERNPWRAARLVWDWETKSISWSPSKVHARTVDALLDRSADSWDYALLACALLRAAGVPSLPVAGFLVDSSRKTARHAWLEFYVYGLGWVPMDPVLGGGARPGGVEIAWDDRSRYFGNLDDRHLAFSRGTSTLVPMSPDGKRASKERGWSFQSFNEEASGSIEAYSSFWGDLEVTGLY